jgi:hypothetical protein
MCAICELKIEFNIGHPQALTVAVATREAMDAGLLPETQAGGALSNMKLRMAAIDALKALQDRLEAAMPDFYVLLIEIGTWGFFHATETGFDPDIQPEPPNVISESQDDRDVVFISSEATMQAIVNGRLNIDHAFDDNLLILDAGESHTKLLRSALDCAFPIAKNQAVNF